MMGRRLRAGVVSALLLLTLSACSLVFREPTGAAGGPEQVFRYAPGEFPVSLDAHRHPTEVAVQTAVQQVLEPLVTLQEGEPVPVLAERWELPDENTWVFTLRQGITFSDGTPFTAADVKASADRLIGMQGPLAPLLAAVSAVEATNDTTVTVRTSEPVGTLLNTLSLLFIGPADQIGSDDYWQAPVGTGPFMVEEFAPDERVTLVRNSRYGGQQPALDRVEILSIPDPAGRVRALRDGEADAITSIPPAQVADVQAAGEVAYELRPGYTHYAHWFNQHRAPFDDERVRRALLHSVHLEGLVGDLFGNLATVAQAPFTQQVFGAPQLAPYEYDPDLARALLAEAGYPDGFSTSIQWPRGGGPAIRELAQGLAAAWAEIGVEVELLEKEPDQWRQDLGDLNWDMNLQTSTTGTGDADFSLGRLYACEPDRMGYCNQELDATLAFARSSLDPAQRQRLYQAAAQIVWEDAVGVFPADLVNNTAYATRVRGYALPINGRPAFSTISLLQSQLPQ